MPLVVVRFEQGEPTYPGALDRINRDGPEVLGVWHRSDPPDDWVHRHNERVEVVQGNRNPCVDHPRLVCRA
jgi:endonuclease I